MWYILLNINALNMIQMNGLEDNISNQMVLF